MKKVLLPINTGLGNAILLFPLIRTIKQIYKDSELDLYGTNQYGANDIFKFDDSINQIYTELPKKKYDIVLSPFLGGGYSFGLKMRIKNCRSTIITHKNQKMGIKGWLIAIMLKCLNIKTVKIIENKHESWNYLTLLEPLGIKSGNFVYNDYFSDALEQLAMIVRTARLSAKKHIKWLKAF